MHDYYLSRTRTGRYDFSVSDGDLVKIDDSGPAILRLLIQGGPWIGDDGEREGESLQDIRMVDQTTQARVQEICERRLSVLTRTGRLSSVSILDVQTEDDRLWAYIEVTRPGVPSETIQIPLGR